MSSSQLPASDRPNPSSHSDPRPAEPAEPAGARGVAGGADRSREAPGEAGPTMTIGELSGITGLSPSAIRFYQRRGLLPARDVEGGWQRYGPETLARLGVIELAKSGGFNLDEVIRILDALDADPDSVPEAEPVWHGLARVKLVEIEARIARLQQLSRLLQDALACAYLPLDRARQVPAALGWAAGAHGAAGTDGGEPGLPPAVRIPDSTADLGPAAGGLAGGTSPGPDGR